MPCTPEVGKKYKFQGLEVEVTRIRNTSGFIHFKVLKNLEGLSQSGEEWEDLQFFKTHANLTLDSNLPIPGRWYKRIFSAGFIRYYLIDRVDQAEKVVYFKRRIEFDSPGGLAQELEPGSTWLDGFEKVFFLREEEEQSTKKKKDDTPEVIVPQWQSERQKADYYGYTSENGIEQLKAEIEYDRDNY